MDDDLVTHHFDHVFFYIVDSLKREIDTYFLASIERPILTHRAILYERMNLIVILMLCEPHLTRKKPLSWIPSSKIRNKTFLKVCRS